MSALIHARRLRVPVGALALALSFGIGGPAHAGGGVAGPVGAVTSLHGPSNVAGDEARPLNLHDNVFPHEQLRTGPDGALSILLDADVVIDLCDDTSLRLVEQDGSGRAGLELDAGEIRIHSASESSLVVLTPAGRFVLGRGSFNIAVDPQTGETRVASSEGRLSAQGVREVERVRFELGPGEQLRMLPGEAPGHRYSRLGPDPLGPDGCFGNPHRAAAMVDTGSSGPDSTLDDMALDEPLPQVSMAPPAGDPVSVLDADVLDPCFATGCSLLAGGELLLDDPNGLTDFDYCGGDCGPLPDPRVPF